MPRPVVIAAVALLLAGSPILGACTTTDLPTAASTTSPSPAGVATSTTPTASPKPEEPRGVVTITAADIPMPAPVTAALAPSAPLRIVSLATGVGETVAALGAADRIVGRDETSDVPQITQVPVMTKAHATNAERVLSVDPDLVLVDASTSPPEALDQIRAAGVPVVEVPEAWSLADIGPRTRAVADAIGATPQAADAVIAESAGVAPTPSGATRPTVAFLYLRGTSAIYLVGGVGSGADALITAAGGVDVGAAAGLEAFVPMTAEAVAALDPDVLLVMTKGLESVGGVDGLVGLPGVAQTTAGRERRVVAVDDTLLLSFGPRTGNLVDALSVAIGQAAA